MKIKSRMMNLKPWSLSIIASILFACSTPTPDQSMQMDNKNDLETIAVLGTNDLHGTLLPLSLKSREVVKTDSIPYEAGGTAVLASYINTLRSEFGEHLLWLDAGDEFQGSIESNSSFGAPMVEFFNRNGLMAAAIGNHEFDFGIPALNARMKEAKYPYLAANVYDKATAQLVQFPNTYPHKIFNIGRLKVGVIGLSTLDTPTTTRAINVKGLQFEDLKSATFDKAKELRKQGANIVLLTAHVGLNCKPGKSTGSHTLRRETDPQGECGEHDEMVRLLRSLPFGTIDGVVSGHSHQIIHHWISGVPVIQGGAYGKYMNVIYLTYDWSQNKLLPDQTRIEGPIPVCLNVFQNQNDCNGDRPAPKAGRGPLIPAKFHGKPIEADAKMNAFLHPIIEKSKVIKNRILGYIDRPLEHPHDRESFMGNFIADAFRASLHTDFALATWGGIRAPLEPGPITFGSLFRTLPFDNELVKIRLTGRQLRNILRVAESGARSFASVSGLMLRLIDLKYNAPMDDLNGDGRDDLWKVNRLLDVRLPDQSQILDEKTYTLAIPDFLATGGDDFGWPMSQIPSNQIEWNTGIMARDAVAQYLDTHNPLVPDLEPRLQFEKPKPQKEHRIRTKHKKRHKRKK